MEIKNFETSKLAKEGGNKLTEFLRAKENKAVLLLLTGGSEMEMFEFVKPEVLGTHITMTILDERFSEDPKVCNFLRLKTLRFYERAVEADVNIFDTSLKVGETMGELVARFETMIREWRDENPRGAVISTFGIGEDGHICGIMPHPENPQKFSELFENDSHWVVGYDAGLKTQFPLRVTTTFSFLRKNLTAGIAYLSGEKKRAALKSLLAPRGALAETPARILNELPNMTLFTDIFMS